MLVILCKNISLIPFQESTPGVNFTNVLRAAFTLIDPQIVKNTVKSSVNFYTFGICACKSCT